MSRTISIVILLVTLPLLATGCGDSGAPPGTVDADPATRLRTALDRWERAENLAAVAEAEVLNTDGTRVALNWTFTIDGESHESVVEVANAAELAGSDDPAVVATFEAGLRQSVRFGGGTYFSRQGHEGPWRVEPVVGGEGPRATDPSQLWRDLSHLLEKGTLADDQIAVEPDDLTEIASDALLLLSSFHAKGLSFWAELTIRFGTDEIVVVSGGDRESVRQASVVLSIDEDSDAVVQTPTDTTDPGLGNSLAEQPGAYRQLAEVLAELSLRDDVPCADVEPEDGGLAGHALADCLEAAGEQVAADLMRQVLEESN